MPLDLAKNFRKTLAELTESLKNELGDSLESVVLYGSFARGDFRAESDIDVLLVLKDKKLGERASDLRYDIDLRNGTFTSLFLAAPQELERYLGHSSPFLENLIQEGQVLYDNGTWARIRGSVIRASG
ncbi:MAG: nucleotidyltransferase domain-containing protein [Chloroflexi bacterium]|nr:nucleotidyltransferase domain-containing protein [Chloroflexota bacterium]